MLMKEIKLKSSFVLQPVMPAQYMCLMNNDKLCRSEAGILFLLLLVIANKKCRILFILNDMVQEPRTLCHDKEHYH